VQKDFVKIVIQIIRFALRRNQNIIFLFVITTFVISSCSHKNPYYHPQYLQQKEIRVDLENVNHRILLIGDAGIPQENEPVLAKLLEVASEIPQKTFIFFLGDNLYPSGMVSENDPWRSEAERRLLAQIEVIKNSGAKGVFIPGNHDWAKGDDEGRRRILEQEKFISEQLNSSNYFLPKSGCPGPVKIDLADVRIIIFDSNFWFYNNFATSSNCPQNSKTDVLNKLTDYVVTAGRKEIILLAHHPLATHGNHGGFYDWKDHIFPLTRIADWLWIPTPVVGSLFPVIKWNVLKQKQNLNSTEYKNFIDDILSAFSEKQALLYASGHDHSLQIIDGGKDVRYKLVSGGGAQVKLTAVTHGDDTIFGHHHAGFIAVDFLKNGQILLRVIEPGDNDVIFSKWIK